MRDLVERFIIFRTAILLKLFIINLIVSTCYKAQMISKRQHILSCSQISANALIACTAFVQETEILNFESRPDSAVRAGAKSAKQNDCCVHLTKIVVNITE